MARLILLYFALVLTAAADWPDPATEAVLPSVALGLTHGPMLGRPGATSMRVWIRTDKPRAFRVRYARHLPLTAESASVAGRTLPDADNTGTVDLSGLHPGTRYYYGIELDGKLADTRLVFTDPWPSFRTLPDATTTADPKGNPKGLFNFAFSVGACASQDPTRSGPQYTDPPVWHNLYRAFGDEIAFHIMNGDYTYEERRDGTPKGIAANYKLYLDRAPGLTRLQRHVPWFFMYDDHEVNDNLFGAGQVGFRKRGSEHVNRDVQLKGWYDFAGWANDPAPHRGALRFGKAKVAKGSGILEVPAADFSKLDPQQVSTILVKTSGATDARDKSPNAGTYGLVRVIDKTKLQVTPAFVADEAVRFSVGTHHYFDRQIGNVHLFFIDTRGERSTFNAKQLDDPKVFLLGEAQRQWLVEGIKDSTADFAFVVSSVGLVVPHSLYHWKASAGDKSKGDGFPGFVHERELILNELDGLNKQVMFLTGDVHASVSAQASDNIWEFMVAPLSSNGHPIGTLGNMPYTGWYNAEGRQAKINWVGSAPNNVHYSRLHRSFFAVIRVNNVFHAPAPDKDKKAGRQTIAYEYPQVIVTWYDGYTAKPVYSETVSMLDLAKPPE